MQTHLSTNHSARAISVIRDIKINVYRKRQTSDSSWEFLRTENKQIKTVRNDSYG